MNPIKLSALASLFDGKLIGDGECTVIDFSNDSRTVATNSLFFAIKGTTVDGHTFVGAALASGGPVVVEDKQVLTSGANAIVVENSRKAWSHAQALKYDHPSADMLVVGVTGTNGKTTIQWMITQGLTQAGNKVLRIGTLGAFFPNTLDEETLTTPDAADIQRYLALAKQGGGNAAALEVSSHALSQERVSDVQFDIAVFSNLTQDHGDYHGSFEEYFEAKAKLFTLAKEAAVICIDNEWGQKLYQSLANSKLRLLSYGYQSEADVTVQNFRQTISGSNFDICYDGSRASFHTTYIGNFNAQNVAAAFAVLLGAGYSFDEASSALQDIPVVPGRLESVGTNDKGIFVDYSHTPDSLENALLALKNVEHNKLWVVFGCGGDRDKTKRPQMGAIAAKLADKVIVTSDNPRTEDPQAILDDILAAGFSAALVEVDREKAITYAVQNMAAGDLLLIAGKGHEDYQIIGTKKIHMSDQEMARAALNS